MAGLGNSRQQKDTIVAKNKTFNSNKLTATTWDSAEVKAKFLNDLAAFVQSGFKPHKFTKALYKRLSLTFGHIAHYNQNGFFYTWFSDVHQQLAWLRHIQTYRPCGDPRCTYSDAEDMFIKWLQGPDGIAIIKQLQNHLQSVEIEAAKKMILHAEATLQKYGA